MLVIGMLELLCVDTGILEFDEFDVTEEVSAIDELWEEVDAVADVPNTKVMLVDGADALLEVAFTIVLVAADRRAATLVNVTPFAAHNPRAY